MAKSTFSGVALKVDNLADMLKAVDTLTKKRLYVGVPDSAATRPPDPDDDKGEPINNAQLAYIHNFGSPAANIPARPFMTLGMNDATPIIKQRMQRLGQIALLGKSEDVEKGLNALGLTVAATVQERLRKGPWVPLSPKTVIARMRARVSVRKKLEAGTAGFLFLKYMTPLIDTSKLIKAITYVIRDDGPSPKTSFAVSQKGLQQMSKLKDVV